MSAPSSSSGPALMRDRIAALKAELAEVRAHRVLVMKKLRNERRCQARLKSKAKGLSTAALKQLLAEKEVEPTPAPKKTCKVKGKKKSRAPAEDRTTVHPTAGEAAPSNDVGAAPSVACGDSSAAAAGSDDVGVAAVAPGTDMSL